MSARRVSLCISIWSAVPSQFLNLVAPVSCSYDPEEGAFMGALVRVGSNKSSSRVSAIFIIIIEPATLPNSSDKLCY